MTAVAVDRDMSEGRIDQDAVACFDMRERRIDHLVAMMTAVVDPIIFAIVALIVNAPTAVKFDNRRLFGMAKGLSAR